MAERRLISGLLSRLDNTMDSTAKILEQTKDRHAPVISLLAQIIKDAGLGDDYTYENRNVFRKLINGYISVPVEGYKITVLPARSFAVDRIIISKIKEGNEHQIGGFGVYLAKGEEKITDISGPFLYTSGQERLNGIDELFEAIDTISQSLSQHDVEVLISEPYNPNLS